MKRIIYRLLASALCCSMLFSNRVIYAADETVANHFTTQVEEEPQDATEETSDNLNNVEEKEQDTESSTPETNTVDLVDDSSDDTETDTENTDSVVEESEEELDDDPQITEAPEEKIDIEATKKDAMELRAVNATAPTKVWVEISFAEGQSYNIEGFPRSGNLYELYLPGNVKVSDCKLFWDGGAQAIYENETYDSGNCPIPSANTSISKTYTFKNGNQELGTFNIITYQGSSGVPPVFIEIDETETTIAQMDNDPNHEITCTGMINIDGTWYVLEKMKGRGNATWTDSKDKKPYNVTLAEKISFPGLDSKKTDKWSFLAEALDHSLLCNRAGFYLGHQLGIAQDTASADVWMNGEYQGCYTITPKTDSFVTKEGFMIEQDNYKEDPVADGGDPQFKPVGFVEQQGNWSSVYNRITVKKMGKTLLNGDDSPGNKEYVAYQIIKPWFQEAWDAIRADDGINPDTGKYYTDYIDIESFAKMYLMHEYVKSYDVCAGSLLFFRDGMTDDHKLIAGPLWDLDNALGATYRNSALGKADDKRNGDRRSAEGYFIDNITEYKTSIYKTLSKHEDFMAEVLYQYNLNHEAFENLPQAYERLMVEIKDSAQMNHYKVDDIPGDYQQWTGNYQGNNHRYGQETTLGSGQYQQTYLETNNSRTDWKNYADNLGTFIKIRSLWFKNNWTVSENYVSFDADNGAIITHQKVVQGNTVSKPSPDPTKDGYKFLGWYQVIDPSEGTTDKQSFDFNTAITESITLKALWAPDNAIIAREATLVLEGLIGVRFTMFVPNPETTTIKVTIHRDKGVEEDYEIPDSDIKKITQSGEERYQYVVKVAAKEMNDMIELHFYDENNNEIQVVSNKGTVVEKVQYSVSTYLKNKSGTDNEKLKKVIQAMRAYGDCAQIYFNYRADEAGEIALEDVNTETLEDHKASMIGENLEGLRVSSCTLVLESETVVRYSLKTLDNHAIDEYVFVLDNDEVQPTQYGDTWRIEAKNIAAKDLDEIHTLKVTQRSSNSDVSVTYIYGPEAYWYNKLTKSTSSDKIKNMCKSMYWYNQAANEYFDGR